MVVVEGGGDCCVVVMGSVEKGQKDSKNIIKSRSNF